MMNNAAAISELMPGMVKHAGLWEGVYTHLDADGAEIDRHRAVVRCEFPDDGPYAYIQHNHFTWDDGREARVELPGVLRGDKLWWDTETFKGCAWETNFGLILLNLERKDEPGARFYEIIALGEGGAHRARTWQWFRDGQLYKRTLCDEKRVA